MGLAILSCFAKKVSKECDIGEGLSRNSRLRTAPPLCTPPSASPVGRCKVSVRILSKIVAEPAITPNGFQDAHDFFNFYKTFFVG